MTGMGFWGKTGGGEGNTGGPRFPEIEEVRAYWQGLREGDLAPMRAAVDPRGIAGALAQTFLIERVAPGIARFRLAGMHLVDLMGMEVRGMVLSSLIDPAQRIAFGQALERVFDGPATLDMHLEGHRGLGRPALAGRLLVLPLRTEARGVAQAVGCLATDGAIGRSPRVFSVARRVIVPLATAAAPPPVAAPEPLRALAEAPAPYRSPDPRRAHLRLVKTD